MGHAIQGFVFRGPAGPEAFAGLRHFARAVLPQGMRLVPVTDALLVEVAERYYPAAPRPHPELRRLSGALELFLLNFSLTVPVAYIEREEFAGIATEAAMVWRDGAALFGPRASRSEWRDGTLVEEGREQRAVNRALRLLGVARGAHADEFEALGLHRRACAEEWLKEAVER